MRIAREEVFGPVLTVLPFDRDDEAAAVANGTEYGLVAAVWTQDIDRAFSLARRLRAGQVYINNWGLGTGIDLPFGGVKGSGFGREKGLEALREYSVMKTTVVRVGGPS
jgi:acyl-CoA reductase-like NAD-dependent aldehyde dehydrogenase